MTDPRPTRTETERPCPFCGADEDFAAHVDAPAGHYIECGKCKARGPLFVSRYFGDHGEHLDPEMGAWRAWRLRSGETPREGEGWQPIETAPRDGTEVIVFRPDAGVFTALYTCEADQFDGEGSWDEEWFTPCGEDLSGDLRPTHWMPLPVGPALSPEPEEGT